MQNHQLIPGGQFLVMLRSRPQAIAVVQGGEDFPEINGELRFYQTPLGVLVMSSLRRLPTAQPPCRKRFFGLHIHEGSGCGDAFAEAGGHYNPTAAAHPCHAGDLPPVVTATGFAWSVTLLGDLTAEETVGRTVILHKGVDDFTSQPAGNSGDRIACGVIYAVQPYGDWVLLPLPQPAEIPPEEEMAAPEPTSAQGEATNTEKTENLFVKSSSQTAESVVE